MYQSIQKEGILLQFSEFLNSRRQNAGALIAALQPDFDYVSILGADIQAKSVRADKNSTNIASGGDTECGFVVKMIGQGVFFEYALDDIDGNIGALAEKITNAFRVSKSLKTPHVGDLRLPDEPLKQDYFRDSDLADFTDRQKLDFCRNLCTDLLAKDEHIMNAFVSLATTQISKLFLSPNRELSQCYGWVNSSMAVVWKENDKVVQAREGANEGNIALVMEQLPKKMDALLHKAHMLTTAKPIVPGVYDVIAAPSIAGLIAHEAFGHGVEMDQFVKDRALAKEYVGKYVASPIVNMRDGAASAESVASYFFDDDGVLAGDTQIIKDGILVTGISDLASAVQLGTAPTGNGRRQCTRHKGYARMTNTFFEAGHDKLEDMIASIDHGYMLFDTNNGMEDPKNWAIQCVAEYGIEIVDGKLTDNWVSPVVMSGYVPDLLKSITMVSDELEIIGAGGCGKGYKEWVRVSDGGPALKAKVKLG